MAVMIFTWMVMARMIDDDVDVIRVMLKVKDEG